MTLVAGHLLVITAVEKREVGKREVEVAAIKTEVRAVARQPIIRKARTFTPILDLRTTCILMAPMCLIRTKTPAMLAGQILLLAMLVLLLPEMPQLPAKRNVTEAQTTLPTRLRVVLNNSLASNKQYSLVFKE
jgi:hypothetical protein